MFYTDQTLLTDSGSPELSTHSTGERGGECGQVVTPVSRKTGALKGERSEFLCGLLYLPLARSGATNLFA